MKLLRSKFFLSRSHCRALDGVSYSLEKVSDIKYVKQMNEKLSDA